MLGLAVFVAAGCSLRSLEELNRCTGKAESAACPVPGAAGVGAQAGGGVGNSGAGGSAIDAGSAGVGNAGGSGGTTTGDGGAAGAPPEPELILLYADHSSADAEAVDESKNVRPTFAIKNDSAEPVDVSELSIRYYFTLEAPTDLVFECDFVRSDQPVNDCEGVIGTFGTLEGVQGAKNYLELAFAPPNDETWLIPELGGESGPIQVRFYKADFSLQDQENDYSFKHAVEDIPPEPWEKVTLYRAGVRVYGVEPQ